MYLAPLRMGISRVAFAGMLAIVLVVVVRTAWVSDDAYITFRCVEQWLHGHGPRWNYGERVQAFTHPLWFLLLTGLTAVLRDPYYSALILSAVCTLAVAAVVVMRASGLSAAMFGFISMLASKAFVDYSTSGLENPLTNLLVGAFLVIWFSDSGAAPSERKALQLTVLASLVLTNRLDAGIIVLPALAVRLTRLPWRVALRVGLLGMLPFAMWEVFAVFYYGFPFPNTAYAKLSTGIPRLELLRQGLAYFGESLRSDPVTLPTIAAGAVAALLRRPAAWPVSVGLVLYLGYVVSIGGDFMSGRFVVTPFVAALLTLVDLAVRVPPLVVRTATCATLVAGLCAPQVAALSGSDYSVLTGSGSGIQDERGYYYPGTGLLRPVGRWRSPVDRSHRTIPRDIWPGHFVAVQDVIGIYGYQSPLLLHIIDVLGIGDPLLARLPSQRPWRIGHFYRPLPAGYLQTIESGSNHIQDPRLAAYYDKLRFVVRGPLSSPERLVTILNINLGRYDHLLRVAPN